jgi:hypothetical protein
MYRGSGLGKLETASITGKNKAKKTNKKSKQIQQTTNNDEAIHTELRTTAKGRNYRNIRGNKQHFDLSQAERHRFNDGWIG